MLSTITIQMTKEYEEQLWAMGLAKAQKEEEISIRKNTIKQEKQVQYLQFMANCPEWCHVSV